MRMVVLLVLAGMGAALLAYGFGSPEQPADFRYANTSDIHTLDPARMSWTQDLRVALNLWEGLTSYDPQTGQAAEGAAYFPPEVSADGLSYTFHLRPDARWSNGDRVTAADFIRGWRRAMEPGTAADYSFYFTDYIEGARAYVTWRYEAVQSLSRLSNPNERAAALDRHAKELDARFAQVGLSAPDDHTLVVRLVRPCPYFVDLVSFPTFSPIHRSIELLRERYAGTPLTAQGLVVYDPQWTKPGPGRNGYPGLITNGAYRLADWRFKQRLRMEANPYSRHFETIACRAVDMVVYPDANTALVAYEAGDLEFLPDADVPYAHALCALAQSGQRPDIHLCPLLATYFFNFNCRPELPDGRDNPFADPRVRRAFSLAVDRQAIAGRVRQRGDRVARSFVPADAIAGYEPPAGLPYDPAAARILLAEAGYAGGVGFPRVTLLYTPNDEKVCQAVARMWELELGVAMDLQCKESKTFAEDKASHRFMIARANWYADYNDPTTFLDCLTTGNGNNDSAYASAAYDALMQAAAAEADPATRLTLLAQAERIIVEEDCPILPILHYATPLAIKPYVRGLRPNPRLVFPFRHVSIER